MRKKTLVAIILIQLLITISAWFVASVAAKQASSITYQLSEHMVELVGTTVAAQSTTISLSVWETSIIEGDEVTVSGAIEPPDEVSITLLYTMPDGSTLTRTATSSSAGLFSDSFTPTLEGSWSVKASWTGSESQEGATSSTKSFTVTPAEYEDGTESGDGTGNGDGTKNGGIWETIPFLWIIVIVAVVLVAIAIVITAIVLSRRQK